MLQVQKSVSGGFRFFFWFTKQAKLSMVAIYVRFRQNMTLYADYIHFVKFIVKTKQCHERYIFS